MKTPDQKQAEHFAQFRTMHPPLARNAAMRECLAGPEHGIDFSTDMHTLRTSQLSACAAMAKAIGWRKSPSSCMSLGGAFFSYLARGLAKPVAPVKREPWRRTDNNFLFNKEA